jgi:hypothetical protein
VKDAKNNEHALRLGDLIDDDVGELADDPLEAARCKSGVPDARMVGETIAIRIDSPHDMIGGIGTAALDVEMDGGDVIQRFLSIGVGSGPLIGIQKGPL